MRIGILALQGDFQKHAEKLEQHGCISLLIKKPSALAAVDALVIPGGESTTLLKLLSPEFRDEISVQVRNGLPVFATCAGLILLANSVTNPAQESLELLDVQVARNAYGSQVDSFISADLRWGISGDHRQQEGVFIRAPRIVHLGSQVQVLLQLNEEPTCVQQNNIVAATFHPELSPGPSPLIEYFLNSCVASN